MKLIYHLSEEAYVQFNMHHIENSKTVQTSLKLQRFGIPILYLFVAIVLSRVTEMPLAYLLVGFAILGLAWILFYPRYFYRSIKKRTEKFIQEGDSKGILGTHEMTLTDEGITDISEGRQTSASWQSLQRLTEDDHNLYIYNTSMSAYILPKQEIAQWREVKDLVLDKMR
ncbi:YcxB family protein [Paenisporosarcina cavernae]|uniref:YcxB family protein n=1 Tax=Paenisporosarcina cavernae TaxID=2320858 RepID=A0A385YW63_9BACL|nr:YcxB family protein [Paenisporosarcina cavernae]AYC30530.1 YcxB family protein [Paenisporosarcina cavernae]